MAGTQHIIARQKQWSHHFMSFIWMFFSAYAKPSELSHLIYNPICVIFMFFFFFLYDFFPTLITRDIKETFTNNLIFMIICFSEFITFCIDSLIICHYFLLFEKTFKSYGISYFMREKQ